MKEDRTLNLKLGSIDIYKAVSLFSENLLTDLLTLVAVVSNLSIG